MVVLPVDLFVEKQKDYTKNRAATGLNCSCSVYLDPFTGLLQEQLTMLCFQIHQSLL